MFFIFVLQRLERYDDSQLLSISYDFEQYHDIPVLIGVDLYGNKLSLGKRVCKRIQEFGFGMRRATYTEGFR